MVTRTSTLGRGAGAAVLAAGGRADGRLGQVGEPRDLLERVHHDMTDARLQRAGQLHEKLVAAVQGDHRGGHPGLERYLEFAAGAHVHAEALLAGPAQHPPAAERLGGVEDRRAFAERLPELTAALPEVRLIADEQRGAELRGEIPHVHATEGEHAAGPACGARPDLRLQRVQVRRSCSRVLGGSTSA